jgi:hypothetical protein
VQLIIADTGPINYLVLIVRCTLQPKTGLRLSRGSGDGVEL